MNPIQISNGSSIDSTKISILPILSINFVGTFGFSIVLPFLVFLVIKYGGNALIYGVMGATYSAFQLIGAPILGRWSDIYGRRKILLLSQIGTLFSWLIFLGALYLPPQKISAIDSDFLGSFTLTIPLIALFIARALDGITGGNVSVANAYLVDITEEDKRSENFGKMALSANLGFILGPAVAGVIGATSWGESLPVFTAILISVIATLIILLKLDDPNPCDLKENPERPNVRKVFGQEHKECYDLKVSKSIGFREIIKIKYIPSLFIIYFLTFLGFNFFYIAFPIHAVENLNWILKDTGLYFSYFGLAMVFSQGPLLRSASRKLSDRMLVIFGSFILAFGFIFLTSNNLLMVYLSATIISIGNGLMWSSILSILSKTGDSQHQGAIQGFASSFGSLASIIGLIIGGILYGMIGSMIFILSSIMILLVFIFSFRLAKVQ